MHQRVIAAVQSVTLQLPCVVLFIGLINRCTEAVVKFTDAPEIFVAFFIG
jgi:hypothetical protein